MVKFVKRAGAAIVLTLCALFIIRCFMVADKSAFSTLIPTDALRTAYADGESVMQSVKISSEMSERGYFSAYGFYYNEESGEVQLALRWNDSAYGYTDTAEDAEFTFVLRNVTTGEEYPVEIVDSKKKSIYNYRKALSYGVKIGEGDKFTAVMLLRDGHEDSITIKWEEQPMVEYKVKSGVMKELTKQ